MTKFITVQNDVQKEKKETVFTHCLTLNAGWSENILKEITFFKKIVYLGNCSLDGDMFACYEKNGQINIYKGIKGDEFND